MGMESGTRIVNLYMKENFSKIRSMEKETNIIKTEAICRDNGKIVNA